MIESSLTTGDILDYTIKCPKCLNEFLPKHGVSVCPTCLARTPHPSDIFWIARSRTHYYSAWDSFYDN